MSIANEYAANALDWAIEGEYPWILQLLLEHDNDKSINNNININAGATAADAIGAPKKKKKTKKNNAIVNGRSMNGRSYLWDAVHKHCMEGHDADELQDQMGLELSLELDHIHMLLKHGADIDQPYEYDHDPYISNYDDDNCESDIDNFDDSSDASKDLKSMNGMTPLHLACHTGMAYLVRLLLQHNADKYRPDNNGETPVFHVIRGGNFEIVRRLVRFKYPNPDYCAPCNLDDFEIDDMENDANGIIHITYHHGTTTLMTAIHQFRSSKLSSTSRILLRRKIIDLLLTEGVNVNARDKDGFTALHYAAGIESCDEYVSTLIKSGAEVNPINKDGWTPLAEAASKGCSEIVYTLLRHGGAFFGVDTT